MSEARSYPAANPCRVCGAVFTVTRKSNATKVNYCSRVCSGRASHGLGPRNYEEDMRSVYERYVIRRGENECWGWRAFKYHGYGRMNVAAPGKPRRIVGAHRVSFMLHSGPIPPGLTVLHRCDNPECTNPRHLRLGTNIDNNRDRDRKGRNAKGDRVGVATLTDEQVIAIRKDGSLNDADWAGRLGVNPQAVNGARSGRTWKHLNDNYPPRASRGRYG